MAYLRLTILTIFLVLNITVYTFAGTTGKISGTIKDKKTGETMPGVNVRIEGGTLGASTNANGGFTILNVSPGIYSIKATMIGYKTVTQTDVRISIDLTTQVDFKMEETIMEGEEVKIVAERKIVRKDLTARTAVVASEEIAKAPVEEMEDILATQAGVTKDSGGGIHIRGGRSGEVAYWVDGVSVTDSYNGNIAVEVENTAIKEMQVISGAFNAEYGQAMSGIVNIATKDGGQEYHGSANVYFGDYFSSKSYDTFGENEANDPNKVFMNTGSFDPSGIQNYQLSLDGPVPGFKDKLTFYATGRYFDSENFLYGQRRFLPHDWSYERTNPETNQDEWVIRASGDGKYVPMNPYMKYSSQFKLTSRLTEKMKLSYNVMWNKAEYKDYNDNHAYKYNPDGVPQKFEDGLTNIFKLTHTLSAKTYYDLSATYTQFKYHHYTHKNLADYVVHPMLSQFKPDYSFNTGGENMNRFERETQSMVLKLDAVSQTVEHHQIKGGFEFRQHEMYYDDVNVIPKTDELGQEIFHVVVDAEGNPIFDEYGFPIGFTIEPQILDTSSPSHDRYTHKPKEASFYLQDKMEYDDIIVNAGVRFDYFDPDGQVLTDPTDPDINRPLRPENQYYDLNGNGERDKDEHGVFSEPEVTLAERQDYWYKDAGSPAQLSPRIGIAYPMSEKGVIHFSYGHFFQIPKFEDLYKNPDFEMEGGTGLTTKMGNTELKPQKTVSYEIGLQQELTEDVGISADIYFRDVRDLVSSDKIVEIFGGSQKYSQYTNRDFGNIRGIAVSLTKRYSNNFSASIDYTYQIAEGNASNPDDAFDDIKGDNEPEKQLLPLLWDQRHLVNVLLTFSVPDNWSLSLLGTLGSGFPYTPSTGAIGAFQENSGRKPSSTNLDIKFSKDLKLGRFYYTFFVNLYNAFDKLNEEDVYGDTGRAYYSLSEQDALNSAAATGRVDYVNSIQEIFREPTRYSEPRRLQLGMSVRY